METSECPPPDAVVRFHLLFPSLDNDLAERTMMTAIGRVQRLESGTTGSGFAIQTRKLMLSSGGRDEDWWAEGVIKRLNESRRQRVASKAGNGQE